MPTRVLHIITMLELGGAQRNTLYSVAHLDRGEFTPGLAWGPGGILDLEARNLAEVELFEIPSLGRSPSPLKDLRALTELRETIRGFQPEIVHTHSSKAGVLGRLAAHLEGIPRIVHSVHGWGFTPTQGPAQRALFFLAERIVSRWTSRWVVVSDANRRQGAALGVLDPQRVSLIRSGIRLAPFRRGGDRRGLRKRLRIPEDAFVVCQVANFKAQKAPLDFLDLATRLCRAESSIHCLMVGDGPLKARVERKVRTRGLGGRIHLLGWRDDIPGLWAAADLGVMTSRHEGLPRAVVEALASGRPVVATAVDGTPEVVVEGVNGFLFAPGDIPAAAAAILRIRRDSSLYQRLSRAATLGLDAFDIDLMVRQQEEMYRCMNSQ